MSSFSSLHSLVYVSVCLLSFCCLSGVLGQQTYSLRCRGPITFNRWWAITGGTGFVDMNFVRGTTGATYVPQPPQGVCTWMDRGIGTGEPNWLRVYFKNSVYYRMELSGTTAFNFVPTASNTGDAVATTAVDLMNHIWILKSNDVTYNFMAYNDGNGNMVLTSVDYSRSPNHMIEISNNNTLPEQTQDHLPGQMEIYQRNQAQLPFNLSASQVMAISFVIGIVAGIVVALSAVAIYQRRFGNIHSQKMLVTGAGKSVEPIQIELAEPQQMSNSQA